MTEPATPYFKAVHPRSWWTRVLLGVVILSHNIACAQDSGGAVAPGGIQRFVAGRWSLAQGSFTNRTDEPIRFSAVATPPDSNGLQYGRIVEVPPNSTREVQWPLRMPQVEPGLLEVQYNIFRGDSDTVARRKNQNRVRTFSTNLTLTEYGHTGVMVSGTESQKDAHDYRELLAVLLRNAKREQVVLPVDAANIGNFSHALDGLDQLCITSDALTQYPEACDAIRIWVQRGGNLFLAVDQTGINVAQQLLADALPLSLINTTSANAITLDLNPTYSEMRFPVRKVEREFAEPIQWMRVVADGGEVIWSIDGWPAAITTNYGRGRILVTTIAPSAFKQGEGKEAAMIPSSSQFADTLFMPLAAPLLTRDQAVETAAKQVGYSIPSREFAIAVVLGFPIILLICGLFLLKRQRGELLLWAVPAAAILACLPAAVMGWSSRSVAPQTVIQQQVVRAIDGETEVVSDGFTTVYTPNSGELALSSTDQSIFLPEADPDNRDYRRLMWESDTQSEWRNIKPPVGIRTGQTREVLSLDSPLRAIASFSETGLTGTLQTGSFTGATDGVLAGTAPNRQSINFQAADWNSTPDQLLAQDEFFTSTLLSQKQLRRAAVFKSVFSGEQATFPNQLSMLYWAEATKSSLQIGDDQTRRDSSVLVVQPVTLVPPKLGQQITIPPVALPYRAVADAEGNVGTVYNNSKRTWIQRERGGEVNLEFDVPRVCTPFEVTSAELQIKLRAGSRTVQVLGGDAAELQVVETFDSPAGTVTVLLPTAKLPRDGRVRVQIKVSGVNIKREEGVTDVDQDDPWEIDRVQLTLKGARTNE